MICVTKFPSVVETDGLFAKAARISAGNSRFFCFWKNCTQFCTQNVCRHCRNQEFLYRLLLVQLAQTVECARLLARERRISGQATTAIATPAADCRMFSGIPAAATIMFPFSYHLARKYPVTMIAAPSRYAGIRTFSPYRRIRQLTTTASSPLISSVGRK